MNPKENGYAEENRSVEDHLPPGTDPAEALQFVREDMERRIGEEKVKVAPDEGLIQGLELMLEGVELSERAVQAARRDPEDEDSEEA